MLGHGGPLVCGHGATIRESACEGLTPDLQPWPEDLLRELEPGAEQPALLPLGDAAQAALLGGHRRGVVARRLVLLARAVEERHGEHLVGLALAPHHERALVARQPRVVLPGGPEGVIALRLD